MALDHRKPQVADSVRKRRLDGRQPADQFRIQIGHFRIAPSGIVLVETPGSGDLRIEMSGDIRLRVVVRDEIDDRASDIVLNLTGHRRDLGRAVGGLRRPMADVDTDAKPLVVSRHAVIDGWRYLPFQKPLVRFYGQVGLLDLE